MASLTPDELKARADLQLQRVKEISASTTKVALISLSALAVIWFGQIRPQSRQLIKYAYSTLPSVYQTVDQVQKTIKKDKKTSKTIAQISQTETQPTSTFLGEQSSEAQPTPNGRNEQAIAKKSEIATELESKPPEANKKIREASAFRRAEFENLTKSVSFELFGLKVSVPTLYAALFWNMLLVIVLAYLARARFAIWARCADALSSLKKLGKDYASLDEIAGSGPLWIAPSPSRPGKDSATMQDLRAAFGWNRLETLPSLAATAGFLMLSLLQLGVISEGYNVLQASNKFTSWVSLTVVPGAIPLDRLEFYPEDLDRRIFTLTDTLATTTENAENFDRSAVEQRLSELVIGPVEGPLISIFLFFMVISTVFLVFWWFWPWRVPTRLTVPPQLPRRLAIGLLVLVGIVFFFLLLGVVKPTWVWLLAERISDYLPAAIRFLVASVLTFCVIELCALAFSFAGRRKLKISDGKTT